MLNRCAVVVKAKKPFLDWLLQLPEPVDAGMTLAQVNDDSRVYLLPDLVMAEDAGPLLEEFFDLIFESELDMWWEEEAEWPEERSLELFGEWFSVEFHSIVDDLVDAQLTDE